MSLTGNLKTMSLPTLVQFVVQDGEQAHIFLEKDAKHNGSLYFDDDGKLCHAVVNYDHTLTSEEVVYELLGWHSGTFSVTKGTVSPANTITQTWNYLLMEGLRLLDERQASGDLASDDLDYLPEETLADMLADMSESDAAAIQALVAQQQEQTQQAQEVEDLMATKREQLQSILDNLVTNSSDVTGAVVVDNDGLLLASALGSNVDGNRVAAVTAGLISLAGRSAQQLEQGAVTQTLIQAQNGNVVAIRAGAKGAFVALTPREVNLGMTFMECRDAADAIQQALE